MTNAGKKQSEDLWPEWLKGCKKSIVWRRSSLLCLSVVLLLWTSAFNSWAQFRCDSSSARHSATMSCRILFGLFVFPMKIINKVKWQVKKCSLWVNAIVELAIHAFCIIAIKRIFTKSKKGVKCRSSYDFDNWGGHFGSKIHIVVNNRGVRFCLIFSILVFSSPFQLHILSEIHF